MVILPHTSLEECKQRAEHGRKIIEAIKIKHLESPVGQFVTVSAGYASIIRKDDDYLSFEKITDINLYKAKNQGRNRISN